MVLGGKVLSSILDAVAYLKLCSVRCIRVASLNAENYGFLQRGSLFSLHPCVCTVHGRLVRQA